MDEIKPYKATERKGETFSYLPPFTPEKAYSNFWYLWKLPFFGEKSVEKVMAEIEACHRDNLGHVVRLTGFDNYTQCRGTAFIVHRSGR